MPEKEKNANPEKEKPASEDYRSREVEEIISERPGFWGKWALPLFLLILLVIVCGTWFIRYPITINASAKLKATNAPRAIVTRKEGKLVALFKHNGDTVGVGDRVAWIESTGSHRQILALAHTLDSSLFLLKNNRSNAVPQLFRTQFDNLGELQPAYQKFRNALQEFTDYLKTGYYFDKKRTMLADIAYLKKKRKSIYSRLKLTQRDVALANENFQAKKKLHQEKVLSNLLKFRIINI